MPNETPLSSNTAFVKFTSDYEYVLGATMGRLLEFQGLFHSMDFANEQLQQIRFDLENTAKNFAELQGLAPGDVGWGYDGMNLDGTPLLRYNTGTLYNGIKAVKTGQTIHLRSEAKDKYGHYYGGHVEFGHGKVPARPHLRPALQMVSQASQGLLRSALYNLLVGTFNGDMRLGFGTGGGRSASYYRKGAGEIEKTLFRGASGRQAKYHFGSIRNYRNFTAGGKGASRKAQAFRNSFSNTAKKSMGWGKQKSLNSGQKAAYRARHTSSGRRALSQKGRQVRQISSRSRNSRMGRDSKSRFINSRVSKGHRPIQNKRGNSYWRQRWSKEFAAKEAAEKRMQAGRSYFNNNAKSVIGKGYGSVAGQSFYHGQNSGKSSSSGRFGQMIRKSLTK